MKKLVIALSAVLYACAGSCNDQSSPQPVPQTQQGGRPPGPVRARSPVNALSALDSGAPATGEE
jgi:hypothetical protein